MFREAGKYQSPQSRARGAAPPSCATLGKLPDLSEPLFPVCKTDTITVFMIYAQRLYAVLEEQDMMHTCHYHFNLP